MARLKLIVCVLVMAMWFVPAIPNLISPSAAHDMHGVALLSVLLLLASYSILGESFGALLRELRRRRR